MVVFLLGHVCLLHSGCEVLLVHLVRPLEEILLAGLVNVHYAVLLLQQKEFVTLNRGRCWGTLLPDFEHHPTESHEKKTT